MFIKKDKKTHYIQIHEPISNIYCKTKKISSFFIELSIKLKFQDQQFGTKKREFVQK